MISLREKDIEKLSIMINLPVIQLERLRSVGLIDQKVACEMLVRYDYSRLKRRRYAIKHIVAALAAEYDIKELEVKHIVAETRLKTIFCPKCGRKTTREQLIRNREMCDECAVKAIEI